MKRLSALLVIGLATMSLSLGAAENVSQQPAAAKSSAAKRTLYAADGRFHQIHTKTLQLGCTNCHASEQKDILFLRKDEALPVGMPGQVDRHMCASCHTAPSKPTWYGAAAR